MNWIIEDFIPAGHRVEDTAPEGSHKTHFGGWEAVNIASGHDFFGHKVKQGNVLVMDNETPMAELEKTLNRFAMGLGYTGYKDLPITIAPQGFEFDRKVEMDRLLITVKQLQPVFVRFDSLISMLPLGRQGINENSSQLGGIIGRDLNRILATMPGGFVQLAVHSKKEVATKTIAELEQAQLQSIVRGHGSIVGEGADTGFILVKISEHPSPTRFAVIIKARRTAIPASKSTLYIEMEEESYGKGWARLKEIPATILPPSQYAKDVYKIFLDGREHKSREIVNILALFSKTECALGIRELIGRKALISGREAQTYQLNPNRFQQCDTDYLNALVT